MFVWVCALLGQAIGTVIISLNSAGDPIVKVWPFDFSHPFPAHLMVNLDLDGTQNCTWEDVLMQELRWTLLLLILDQSQLPFSLVCMSAQFISLKIC